MKYFDNKAPIEVKWMLLINDSEQESAEYDCIWSWGPLLDLND